MLANTLYRKISFKLEDAKSNKNDHLLLLDVKMDNQKLAFLYPLSANPTKWSNTLK